MAKGNYGVTAFGGGTGGGGSSGSGGGSGSGKNFSRIKQTFAKGGYLPGVFEHGGGKPSKQGNSIKKIAEAYSPSENNIAADFRNSLKKKSK